ncbi:MAG TPA: type II toxin-antitoxin system RelE/ParE family toxin [Burkholderiaceae bacterium]|nr:type II toxin-antitoxin system RelE/ParE family toxin [Burkholderiaceae bacterium]
MRYTIHYYSEAVQTDIMALPATLQARYISLTDRMQAYGPNLGEPHTKPFGGGLFELRLKGADGIARVFYCTLVGRRVVMLHSFIKKSDKTPLAELRIAASRLKEVKNADSRADEGEDVR